MIMAQSRLWQYFHMAFDQPFGIIHNTGIGRVAASLKIKQMNSPGFMVSIIRLSQQCAKGRLNINDTENRLIAVEHFIGGARFDRAEFISAINGSSFVGRSIKNVERRSQRDWIIENAF